jgi:hypothetical protein
VIDKNKAQLGITLYPPTSNKEIEDFENSIKIKLPEDIKTFYKFCNGFESNEDMFRIIPLEEILSSWEDYTGSDFYIAEYMVYCDIWIFSTIGDNNYKICTHDKTILTDSFTEFLHRFIIGGVFEKAGLYDWAETLNKSNP